MTTSPTKSEANRSIGKHQINEQRASILDAAETLFLQNGLGKTSMIEIARQAGISKVTLYRYFANRDVIAVEIQMRMLGKISALNAPEDRDQTHEGLKKEAQSMIRNFESLRDAYRYIGMFDKIYLDEMPDVALTRWTKEQLTTSIWNPNHSRAADPNDANKNEVAVILNTVTWFLEKLALRGELTWSDNEIPLEQHLKIFEDMIMAYFDRTGKPQENKE